MMEGRLDAVFRHPVKGLTPESLERVVLEEGGVFPNDRRYAVEVGPSGFNPASPVHVSKMKFAVLARFPELARLRTRLDDGSGLLRVEDAHGFGVEVALSTSSGRASLARFLEVYLSGSVNLPFSVLEAPSGYMFSDHSMGRVSLVNMASLRLFESALGRSVDRLRFRANLYLEGLEPFAEDDWPPGSRIRIGGVEFSVLAPIVRCIATHVDVVSGVRDLEVVDRLRETFGRTTMGVYLTIAGGGALSLGDGVRLP
jgi:hypothetical protein